MADKSMIKDAKGFMAVVSLGLLLLARGCSSGEGKPLLTLQENLVIGEQGSAAREDTFSSIRSVQADDRGRIYVLDNRECRVKVFDAKGKLILSFGRKGQGPGEFQSPRRMSISGKALSIIDATNKKVLRFDLNGTLLTEIDFRWIGGLFTAEAEAGGALFGDLIEFRNDGSIMSKLVRTDLTDRSTLVLDQVPMASAPKLNLLPADYLVRGLPDGRMVWIHTAAYRLNVLSADGKTQFRRDRDFKPIKITEKAREKRIIEMYGGKDKVPSEITLDWSEYFNPVDSLEIADDGRIYVKTAAKDAKGRSRYDVFAGPDCEYQGTFHHPGEERLHTVRSGMAYLAADNEEGCPIVKRYEIRLSK